MAWLVNGMRVPEELVREESHRIARDPYWNTVLDPAERAQQLRSAAERCAQDRVLISQKAAADLRPIPREEIEAEIERQQKQAGSQIPLPPEELSRQVEWALRFERFRREMVVAAAPPTTEELLAFFAENTAQFRKPETFEASQIFKRVARDQSEDQAEAGILEALAELERGLSFAAAADRFSDCREPGGRLAEFPAGEMVEEFEEELRGLLPGERSGVFTTPLGFHIAMLHSITPARPATFEEVRPKIEGVLLYVRQHEAYQRSLEQMRSTAEINWIPET